MMANIRTDIGDKIIHEYLKLPFEKIPTSTEITFIHTTGKGQTVRSIQLSRRFIIRLDFDMKEIPPNERREKWTITW